MSVYEDFVVKMRPGREAGLPEVADDLALPDARAFGHAAGEAGKVIVGRDIAIGMLDFDAASVARIPSGRDNRAIAGCKDLRSYRRRPIDTGVRARIAEDRMIADAETRGQPACNDRCADQEFARRTAVLIVEIDQAVIAGLEPVIAEGLVVRGDRGIKELVAIFPLVTLVVEDLEKSPLETAR